VLYRLTVAARADIKDILRRTGQQFGSAQRSRYNRLIETAAAMVSSAPFRPGSRSRDECGPGVRSFHVGLAAGRSRSAAHVIYFLPQQSNGPDAAVLILRVLHERMDPARHFDPDL
jgi:toxin ParE1/3/4